MSSDSAGDVALKRQQAEEKAISLRDDVLLESGTDPRTRLGRHLSDESHQNDTNDSISNALTTENMQRFSQTNRMAKLRREESAELDGSSLNVSVGDTNDDALSRVATGRNDSPAKRGSG